MPEFERKCPKCSAIMKKMDFASIEKSRRNFIAAPNISSVNTTSGASTYPIVFDKELVTKELVPYECTNPQCMCKRSFPD